MAKLLRVPRATSLLSICFLLGLIGASGMLVRADTPVSDTGTWTATADLGQLPAGAAAATLTDGRLVIAGGTGDAGPRRLVSVFDSSTWQWAAAGSLQVARTDAAAASLPDGRVVVAGGTGVDGVTGSIEIFDPATGDSTAAGALTVARFGAAAAALEDGRVLIAGGSDGSVSLSSVEVFDPATGASTPLDSQLATPRKFATATRLITGHVVVAGGNDGSDDLSSAELWHPEASVFTTMASSLTTARQGHAAVRLPNNGSVLIVGGSSAGQALNSSELLLPEQAEDPYDFVEGTFAATGGMTAARVGGVVAPTAADGIAIAGGAGLSAAEAYHFATIKTDKDDYAPYENALITGSGWTPNSTVTLVFQEVPAVHADYQLTVPTDANGNISFGDWAPEPHDLNVRFYLLASDGASKAQTTFTDSSPSSATVQIRKSNCITASTSFNSGDTVCANSSVTVSSTGNQSYRAQWFAPGATSATFEDSHTLSGSGTTTFNDSHMVSTPGTWTVKGCGSASCTGSNLLNTSTFTVSGATAADQTISVGTPAPANAAYGTSFNVAATATSGLPVAISTSGVCSGSGTSNATVTMNSGTGTCTVSYNQAGNSSFNPAPQVQNTTTATKATLTVTASSPSVTYGDPVPTITPTYGTFVGTDTASVLDTEPTCTTAYTQTSTAGSTPVTSCSGGSDDNYSFSFVNGSVTIAKATQAAVTVTAPSDVTYGSPQTATATGGSGTGAVSFSTGASTGCSVAGDQVTVTNASGTCALTATKAGDDNYEVSAPSASFPVALHKAAQAAVTVTAPSDVTYGTPQTATATGGSGTGAVSFSTGASTGCSVAGDQVTVTNASGTCALTATKAGDDNYEVSAPSASFPVTLHKAAQAAVTVTGPSAVTYGAPQTATATGGSGTGALSFSVGTSTGCSLSGNLVSVTNAAGTCVLTATRAGDINYLDSAESTGVSVTLLKATLTVTASSPSVTYGDPVPAITPLYGAFVNPDTAAVLDAAPTCTTAYTPMSNVGTTPATSCSGGADNNYSFSFVNGSVTITKAASATVITCPASVVYTGSPLTPCTAAVTGAGLNTTATVVYTNNLLVGTATANATYPGDMNHFGSVASQQTFAITTAFCFTGFLAPIDGAVESGNGGSFADPVRAFKLGSTIPVKFVLSSIASGCSAVVTTGIHTLQAIKYANATDSDPAIDTTPTDAATSGNQFRLTDMEWHFNLSTKGGFSQGTWLLKATLVDGSAKSVFISIKK